MEKPKSAYKEMIPLVLFVMVIAQSVSQFIFARYVHFHAQNRVLDPAHYTAEVVPVSTTSTASHPANRFGRSKDDSYAIKVTTLGTAHEMDRTFKNLLPFLGLGIAGAVAEIYAMRRRAIKIA